MSPEELVGSAVIGGVLGTIGAMIALAIVSLFSRNK